MTFYGRPANAEDEPNYQDCDSHTRKRYSVSAVPRSARDGDHFGVNGRWYWPSPGGWDEGGNAAGDRSPGPLIRPAARRGPVPMPPAKPPGHRR